MTASTKARADAPEPTTDDTWEPSESERRKIRREAFGRLLRETREDKGLTSPGLSELLALTVDHDPELTRQPASIRHYETGRSEPENPWVVRGLERALQVRKGTFFKALDMKMPDTDMPPLRRPAAVAASEQVWRKQVEADMRAMASAIENLSAVVIDLRAKLEADAPAPAPSSGR